ncbi:unnamed protein product [Cylicocyclus nassatus]|uniref:Peptidase A1 domain-containing protein n=1 Tax=Cylicocyclus nassatus TaxID=53992 RepID=A0AA36H1B0_CYLNA|nr:unnamed protein product [Cylicocyclus nassatus]
MRLSIFAVVFGAASSAVFHAPLLWRRSEKVEMIAKGKYSDYKDKLESLRKHDTAGIMLHELSSEYFQQITIGRPEQYPFWMWLTTFSSMMWITTSQCKSPICDQMKKFDPDNSTTFISFIDSWKSVAYDGTASGQKMGSDEMRLGGVHESQQFVLRTQFGIATKVNVTQNEVHYDGTIGLAFGEYNNSKGFPFVTNAIEKGNFDKPVFTIWLRPYPVVGDSGGVITYGDIDTYNCGPVIQYENITSDIAYIYTIDRISMGTWLYKMRFDVEIHLSSFILGPEYIVELFAKDASVEIGDDGEYYVDCDAKFNDLEISSGDIIYKISYEKLIIQGRVKTWLEKRRESRYGY